MTFILATKLSFRLERQPANAALQILLEVEELVKVIGANVPETVKSLSAVFCLKASGINFNAALVFERLPESGTGGAGGDVSIRPFARADEEFGHEIEGCAGGLELKDFGFLKSFRCAKTRCGTSAKLIFSCLIAEVLHLIPNARGAFWQSGKGLRSHCSKRGVRRRRDAPEN